MLIKRAANPKSRGTAPECPPLLWSPEPGSPGAELERFPGAVTAPCHSKAAWPGSTANTGSETKGESTAQPGTCPGLAWYPCGASPVSPERWGCHRSSSATSPVCQPRHRHVANPLLACSSHSYGCLCFCSTISHLGVSGIKQDNLQVFPRP